jgi:hypothetical protein
MPKATIQNSTVSALLNPQENVVVPSNQVWKVYISGEDDFPFIRFDGDRIARFRNDAQTMEGPYILSSGTSISSDEQIYVSGFVIEGD